MKLIYQIRCVINGRVYVGQTHDLRKREADHRQKLLRGNHYSKDLQSDFDKYGLDAFVFEVLEMNIPREDLDERERSWISLRDNPYNIESGGVKNKKLAESTKKQLSAKAKVRYPEYCDVLNSADAIHKRSQSNTGKRRSEEFRKRMSELAKVRTGERNAFYGRTHSEETKRRIGAANRGNSDSGKAKVPIIAVALATGITKEYASKAAAKRDGFPSVSSINAVIAGTKPHYKQHTFKLKYDNTEVN